MTETEAAAQQIEHFDVVIEVNRLPGGLRQRSLYLPGYSSRTAGGLPIAAHRAK